MKKEEIIIAVLMIFFIASVPIKNMIQGKTKDDVKPYWCTECNEFNKKTCEFDNGNIKYIECDSIN